MCSGKCRASFTGRSLPEGVRVTVRGSAQAMQTSFSAFGFGLILSTLLVYLILVAQFQSFIDPLLILLAVPTGLTGVLLVLFLTDTTLNVMSLMGVVMMVGIVVSNSILIVEFTNRLREEGHSLREAVSLACRVRLRPVLMTSLATLMGLIPMALKLGTGSEAYAPLARAIIGGLAVSVVLTVFIVPAAYYIVHRKDEPRSGPAGAEPTAMRQHLLAGFGAFVVAATTVCGTTACAGIRRGRSRASLMAARSSAVAGSPAGACDARSLRYPGAGADSPRPPANPDSRTGARHCVEEPSGNRGRRLSCSRCGRGLPAGALRPVAAGESLRLVRSGGIVPIPASWPAGSIIPPSTIEPPLAPRPASSSPISAGPPTWPRAPDCRRARKIRTPRQPGSRCFSRSTGASSASCKRRRCRVSLSRPSTPANCCSTESASWPPTSSNRSSM